MLPSTHNWDLNYHDETTWSPWPTPFYILFVANFYGKVYRYPETQTVVLQFSAESKNSANRAVTLFHQTSRHSSIIPGLLPLQRSQITIISMPCSRNCPHNYVLVCSCVKQTLGYLPHGYPIFFLSAIVFCIKFSLACQPLMMREVVTDGL
jgi:hypothetical protein